MAHNPRTQPKEGLFRESGPNPQRAFFVSGGRVTSFNPLGREIGSRDLDRFNSVDSRRLLTEEGLKELGIGSLSELPEISTPDIKRFFGVQDIKDFTDVAGVRKTGLGAASQGFNLLDEPRSAAAQAFLDSRQNPPQSFAIRTTPTPLPSPTFTPSPSDEPTIQAVMQANNLSREQVIRALGISQQQRVPLSEGLRQLTVQPSGEQQQPQFQGATPSVQENVALAEPVATEPFRLPPISLEFDQDFFESLSTAPVTFQDIQGLLDEQRTLRERILAQGPSVREQEIKEELEEIRSKAEFEQAGLQLGIADIQAQPVSTRLQVGRGAELTRQAGARVQALQATENKLLRELGLEQDLRLAETEKLGTLLGFNREDINLQFQVQDRINQQQQQVFQNVLALQSSQRSQFSSIMGQLEGVDPDGLSLNDKTRVANLAESVGVPAGVVFEGLKAQFSQRQFENLIQEKKQLLQEREFGLAERRLEVGKPPTQGQFTAAGYAERVQDANTIFDSLESDISAMSSFSFGVQRLLPNAAKSPVMQQQEQAERTL